MSDNRKRKKLLEGYSVIRTQLSGHYQDTFYTIRIDAFARAPIKCT